MRAHAAVLLRHCTLPARVTNEAEEYCLHVRELLEIPGEILFKVIIANDLGYALLLMQRYDEAEQFLHLSNRPSTNRGELLPVGGFGQHRIHRHFDLD